MGEIDLHLDFTKSVIVESERLEWVPSPQRGVVRRRLEREYAESGRATTIVRYAPGVSFPAHRHPGGEEYYVLEGKFSDESGDFAAGHYVRNPPGSRHAPFSENGCTIFVKLCQMKATDERQVVVNTREKSWEPGRQAGHSVMPLYGGPDESVTLEKLDPGVALDPCVAHGGEEILVLEGCLDRAGVTYGRYTWLRTAVGAESDLSSNRGCTLWVKRGHLQREGHQ